MRLPLLAVALTAIQPAVPAPAPDLGHAAERLTASGGVGEAYVLGLAAGAPVALLDDAGEPVGTVAANDLGAALVRDLAPGAYSFRAGDTSVDVEVLSGDDHPGDGFYRAQTLAPGLNYVTMRDGIELAATLRLPPGMGLDDGPFPTVIEYSGYAAAAPGDLLGALVDPDAVDEELPLPAASTAIGSVLMPLLGFASVSVQMRGTGCSGGAFGLLDQIAALDGYDTVEAVAAQPWVSNGTVGLVGISYSGISQLLVAGTRPPSLAAIAPLSPTDDLYSVGYPGGIYNTGFAQSWLDDRVEDARPAHEGGQAWAQEMIALGDARCAANQALHGWALSVDDLLGDSTARLAEPFDARSPLLAASRIAVPTFIAGALQDEQTGGQWVELLTALEGTPHVWATIVNGTHVDALGPAIIGRWLEFLSLYVADRPTAATAAIADLAPALYSLLAAGSPAAPVDDLRFQDAATTETARAAFAADSRVRLLFDNGGDNAALRHGAGALDPSWELGFDAWPPSTADATRWYLADDGALTTDRGAASQVAYRPDPAARPALSLRPDGDPWAADPGYDWAPVTDDAGLGFITDPLEHDLVVVGPASVSLYLASTAEDTDVQVTVSEVRPDGTEMFVQTGQLRASHRALDADRSTELLAAPTFDPHDAAVLPASEATELRVPINAIGHAFRAGSRLRVTIVAPGGDRPQWRFDTPATGGGVTNTISLGGATASVLVLPVIPGAAAGAPRPEQCPSNRGQPCRAYIPAGNGG